MSSLGLPRGLQDEILRSCEDFPVRHFVLDNSGSMSECDGHVPVSSGRHETFMECSRWTELLRSVSWLGNLAIGLEAHAEFRLINPTSGVSVANLGMGLAEQEQEQLRRITSSSPTGRTPICAAIREVVESIRARASDLRASGQRALVEIATDGISTDGDLASALRPLEQLPVFVVVRLCTDDDQVVNYWNDIDSQLELEMDVLDDLAGEAAEVHAVNPWLVYGEALHHVREWGSSNKLLDLLDESRFTAAQASAMVELVLGKDVVDEANLPPASLDLDGFCTGLEQLQHRLVGYRAGAPNLPASAAHLIFDPLAKRKAHWFKTRALKARFADSIFTQARKAWRHTVTGDREVRVRDWLFSHTPARRGA